MLWSKAIGAGGNISSVLSFLQNYTEFGTGSTTYTIPNSGPLVGDIAILHYVTLQDNMATIPSGWTEISYTPSTTNYRQIQRVICKILTESDLGSTLTLSTSTISVLINTYSRNRIITFTPSTAISQINISSLNVDENTVPSRTKDTSIYEPPNIVFAAASFYNGSNNGGFSETYWTQEYINGSTTQIITAFEIQNEINIDRTITPVFTGSAYINHTFVINAA